jgi:large subunit ribosomal protein L4
MSAVTIHNAEAPATVELPAELFDAPVNVALIHQVVVAQQAAARQGTHSTKTRGEVRGGGRKPYRQKGTGRARQGSTRAPQFAGGGIVHGPTPRNYDQRTPKKMKAAALRGALSDRARNGRVHVVAGFLEGDEPSTREAVHALSEVTSSRHVLVVLGSGDVATWKSLRNVPSVHLLDVGQLNTYDVLVSDDVVFTQDALSEFVAARTDGAELVITEQKPAKKAAAKKTPAKRAAAEAEPAEADEPEVAAAEVEQAKVEPVEEADVEADPAEAEKEDS